MSSKGIVAEFEGAFAKYLGVRHAVAVSSGTAGLMVALMALQLNPKDEVVTTPLTHVSTANAVLNAGAIPLFRDVDPDTLCLEPQSAGAAVTKRTSCILGVDLYGYPLDFTAYEDFRKRSVAIVEDAAQALGASRNGRMVGTQSDLAVFSFYDTKQLRLGEGGMITTQDAELAERCRMIRSHGQRRAYYHTLLGYNFRLPASIAEVGIDALSRLRDGLRHRRRIAEVYTEHLEGQDGLLFQGHDATTLHAYYMFPLVVSRMSPSRIDTLARGLSTEFDCDVGRGYGLLTYQQPLYKRLDRFFWGAKLMNFPDYTKCKLPHAEYVVRRLLELPTGGHMDEEKAARLSRRLIHSLKS